MKNLLSVCRVLACGLTAAFLIAASGNLTVRRVTAEDAARGWNAKAAAAYLDSREAWWAGWEDAQRDHGTFCVSCHTAVPYAIARPSLRKALGESKPSEIERALLEDVAKRVRLWKEVAPVYSDQDAGPHKSAESRATEAVLNAFVLASHDERSGKLSSETRSAFQNLWALQQTTGEKKGAWEWQLFELNPWEGDISTYYGATLAAIAVGAAPENYRSAPEIQPNLKMLREYLEREYASQPTLNRVNLLWASAKYPEILSRERQKSILEEILSKQQNDGGWNTFSMSKTWKDWGPSSLLGRWKRADGSSQDLQSDGFATGLSVFVLREAGMEKTDARIKRARDWLVQHQNEKDGMWSASSLNKRRDPASNAGRFMSDAATAFAVLALSETD